MKKVFSSRADVELLVDEFYQRVQKDELLSPIFNDVAQVDWAHHLPTMYDFWEDLLFGSDKYHGRPYPKHHVLPLKRDHFERWLALFTETLDTHFEGIKADEAKFRAHRIAQNFQHNMRILKP